MSVHFRDLAARRHQRKAAETPVCCDGGMTVDRSAVPAVAGHSGVGPCVDGLRIPLVVADQGCISGVNFFTNILRARFLGIEGFGRVTLAGMVVLFANSVQSAAIIQPMLSVSPKQADADAEAYYGAVLVHQVMMAGLAFAVVFMGVEVCAVAEPSWAITSLAVPLAVAVLAGQAQDFFRRYFFVRGRAATAVVSDAIRYLSQLILLYDRCRRIYHIGVVS